MKISPTFYKILFGLSLLSFLIFLGAYYSDAGSYAGIPLIISFITLAIAFTGYKALSGFSFTVWIFAAVSASMFYPNLFLQYGDFKLTVLIVPLLQIIMFGMGTAMSLQDFVGVIKMPKGVLIGIICQFTIMPFVGMSVAWLFGFPPEIAAGIILVGSSPSGLASNVMAFIAKANIALSVTLTACATLLAPIMTPFLMQTLAGEYVPIDFLGMMWSIFRMVILPIVAGLLFHFAAHQADRRSIRKVLAIIAATFIGVYLLNKLFGYAWLGELMVFNLVIFGVTLLAWYLQKFAAKLENIMPLVSMLGIAVIITIITASGRDNLLTIGLTLILACFIHNMTGYFLGYSFCKLLKMDEASCRTIALEVGLQNGGLASALAQTMGKVATVGLAPAVFGPLMNITGSSLATWWRGIPVEKPSEEAITT